MEKYMYVYFSFESKSSKTNQRVPLTVRRLTINFERNSQIVTFVTFIVVIREIPASVLFCQYGNLLEQVSE